MKLVRFGSPGSEKPGLWLEDALGPGLHGVLDVNAMAYDLHDYDRHFFEHGGLDRLRLLQADPRPRILPAHGLRIAPPVARPGKIVCLGKNYADHAREFDSQIPATPVLFSKATTSLNGPFDPIRLPPRTRVADGEAELALVIGRRSKGLTEGEALDAVAGYTILNDVTDREAQKAGLQWFFGKSFDTFCPLGPFLVTADEIPDPHRLRVFSRLNGTTLQDGYTGDMLFRIPFLLSFITQAVTLEPGDVIATGTPAGIGSARKPPLVLKAGDRLETGVEGLGAQIAMVESD